MTEKCKFGHCEHLPTWHEEGVCWKVVKPEFEDARKFCNCKEDKNFIRTFERLGYTELADDDWMVAKHCAKCDKVFTLRIDNNLCLSCKDLS